MLWHFRIDLIDKCDQIPIEKATVNQEGPSPLCWNLTARSLKLEIGPKLTVPLALVHSAKGAWPNPSGQHHLTGFYFPVIAWISLSTRPLKQVEIIHNPQNANSLLEAGLSKEGSSHPRLSFKDGHCHCSYNSVLEEMPIYWAVCSQMATYRMWTRQGRGYWQSFSFNIFY